MIRLFTYYRRNMLTNRHLLGEHILKIRSVHVMRCAIWYHLDNFQNVKNTHGGVLLLVKLQATKINTPP